MMFVVDPEHTYAWPVTIHKPTDQGFVDQTLSVRFKALTIETMDELIARGGDGELMRVALIDAEIGDAAGRRLPWSDELRETLLNIPYVRPAVVRAYFDSVYGAKEKNSPTSPAGGRAAAPATPSSKTS